tara:strand:- start:79 stop:255 length:177 start_codon:yes stop_codon:yes gene_type:complete
MLAVVGVVDIVVTLVLLVLVAGGLVAMGLLLVLMEQTTLEVAVEVVVLPLVGMVVTEL